MFNALPSFLADKLSFILDTTTVKTYMPSMDHGDWESFGKRFFNLHKKTFGAKIQLGVAMQRRPVPLFASVAPAGMHDLTIARQSDGVFAQMRHGERTLGDPGYLGDPERIYAPPRRNMQAYVAEEDKAELTLQRRVEQANKIMKRFKIIGTTYRKGAVHAYPDIQLLAPVIARLVFWDLLLNQEHGGLIHSSGPSPDFVPWRAGEVRDEGAVARYETRNMRAMLNMQSRNRIGKRNLSDRMRKQRALRLQQVGVTLRRPNAGNPTRKRIVILK